jgi:uncharacterized membrane protein (UPF0127 family)
MSSLTLGSANGCPRYDIVAHLSVASGPDAGESHRVPWLLLDDKVLASLDIADSPRVRARGLLGSDGIDGALLLRPARAVHTLGMRYAIDVAFCDADLVVLRTTRMAPHRIGRPCVKARSVLEAEAGAFERWGVVPGIQLEVRQ